MFHKVSGRTLQRNVKELKEQRALNEEHAIEEQAVPIYREEVRNTLRNPDYDSPY